MEFNWNYDLSSAILKLNAANKSPINIKCELFVVMPLFFWMWAQNVISFFVMKWTAITENNLNNFVQKLGFMSGKINWNLCLLCRFKVVMLILFRNQVLSCSTIMHDINGFRSLSLSMKMWKYFCCFLALLQCRMLVYYIVRNVDSRKLIRTCWNFHACSLSSNKLSMPETLPNPSSLFNYNYKWNFQFCRFYFSISRFWNSSLSAQNKITQCEGLLINHNKLKDLPS